MDLSKLSFTCGNNKRDYVPKYGHRGLFVEIITESLCLLYIHSCMDVVFDGNCG